MEEVDADPSIRDFLDPSDYGGKLGDHELNDREPDESFLWLDSMNGETITDWTMYNSPAVEGAIWNGVQLEDALAHYYIEDVPREVDRRYRVLQVDLEADYPYKYRTKKDNDEEGYDTDEDTDHQIAEAEKAEEEKDEEEKVELPAVVGPPHAAAAAGAAQPLHAECTVPGCPDAAIDGPTTVSTRSTSLPTAACRRSPTPAAVLCAIHPARLATCGPPSGERQR